MNGRAAAAGDRMHHRRLDFEVAPRDEELAHRLHDLRPLDEHITRYRIGDEIDVALTVALLLVGEPVELFRQPRRLREEPDRGHLDRQLAGLGLEQRSRRPDEVAQIPVLECVERLRSKRVERHVELDAAAHVLQRRERGPAHHALQHHPAGDRYGLMQRFELLVALVVELRRAAPRRAHRAGNRWDTPGRASAARPASPGARR